MSSKPNWRALLLRRKVLDGTPSNLARKLSVIDLTMLGMGATLGAGAYVLVGVIAKTKTGPAIVLSFLISGFASILSALCYAEFGARVPRAGSAYVYSYVTVGEVFAWTTGWQLLLEYIIGGSSVARAWSGYVDSLAGGAISTYLNDTVGHWHVSGLAAYPDFLAFGMTLFLSVICSIGVRESTIINNALTVTNVAVILFVCIAGAFFVDKQNFTPFAPFGVSGIFTGAATAFFSYVGFDVIATSAEEAKNPQRNIPIAIVTSLILCMLCYSAVSIVVCLMVPYYNLDPTAPLSKAFSATSAKWAGVVIAVGAVAGLSTSLMTCIFPMPRIIYAIASDGLLPAWLGRVHPRFNTPLVATMLCGTLSGLMALIFDLDALADMMSIGTLLSYTLVSGSVLVLRYREHDARVEQARRKLLDDEAALHHHYDATQDQPLMGASTSRSSAMARMARTPFSLLPRAELHSFSMWGIGSLTAYATSAMLTAVIVTGSIILSVGTIILQTYTLSSVGSGFMYTLVTLGSLVFLYGLGCLYMLPHQRPEGVSFVTPAVPFLPCLSMLVNVYLLVSLSPMTWVRFAVWCAIGTLIYGFYGVWHSNAPIIARELSDRRASIEVSHAVGTINPSHAEPHA